VDVKCKFPWELSIQEVGKLYTNCSRDSTKKIGGISHEGEGEGGKKKEKKRGGKKHPTFIHLNNVNNIFMG